MITQEKDKLDDDFRYLKRNIKNHFNLHIHMGHVIDIENSEDANKIQGLSSRAGRVAAMRCDSMCCLLFKKGRLFPDYPDLFVTIVARNTFLGELKPSEISQPLCEKCSKGSEGQNEIIYQNTTETTRLQVPNQNSS